jgi:hypothetical protein
MRDSIADAKEARLRAERYVGRVEYDVSVNGTRITRSRSEISGAQTEIAKIKNSWLRRFRKRALAKAQRNLADATQKETNLLLDQEALRDQLTEAQEHRDSLWVKSDLALSGPAFAAWNIAVERFVAVSLSNKIWDITADRSKRSGEERSVANRVIERTETQLSVTELSFFDPGVPGLHWYNANGDDLYLFPGFMVVVRSDNEFALISSADFEIKINLVQFDEREGVPTDAKIVGETWQYANAKGGPDRRYRDNQSFPVTLYAEMRFRSSTGLDESFLFSNAEAAAHFADAWADLEKSIRR